MRALDMLIPSTGVFFLLLLTAWGAVFSGAAAAGMQAGIAAVFHAPVAVGLAIGAGLAGVWGKNEGAAALPVAFLAMLAAGGLTDPRLAYFTFVQAGFVASALLFAVALTCVRHAGWVLTCGVAGIAGFFLGAQLMVSAPIAPVHHLAGALLVVMLLAGCGAGFGVATDTSRM